MAVKQGFAAGLRRTLGMFKKELLTILRQPRLIVMLVLAPFLILLVFGLGYREELPPLRTMIVVGGQDAGLAADLDELSDSFGAGIDLVGTSTDEVEASTRLMSGDLDLVVVAPEGAIESLERGEKADFRVIHSEVDPAVIGGIELLSRLSVDEINRRVLASFLGDAQQESTTLNAPVRDMRESAQRLVTAIENNDDSAADSERESLRTSLSELEDGSGSSFLDRVAESLGVEAQGSEGIEASLAEIQLGDDETSIESARELEQSLADLEEQLSTAQGIETALLVSPFGADVEGLTDVPEEPAAFYAPGVLVVLIQHLAVTFAALSLVRERELGLTELFRVSPLSVGATLIGKYAAFLVITTVVATFLLGTMLLFGVPILAHLLMVVLILLLVILASLGLGFLISGISRSDSQAIQYTMIVLLVTIFFSGFVLPLDQLVPAVRWVSYLIPATYGISAFHDVVFRAIEPDALLVGGLAAYVLALGAASWVLTRRDVSKVMG